MQTAFVQKWLCIINTIRGQANDDIWFTKIHGNLNQQSWVSPSFSADGGGQCQQKPAEARGHEGHFVHKGTACGWEPAPGP